MKKLSTFLSYHNAVPVLFGVLFLSVGGAFAASPELRSAVLSSSETVRSADNTYIVGANLDAFEPKLQITSVTEDDAAYYVAYTLSTIDIVDYVWKDVVRETTLKVAKDDLGGRDLGLYVAEELNEVAQVQLAYLKEVQQIEKSRGLSQKVVATAYAGLVGKFLDPKEEILPGYVPVVPPEQKPEPEESKQEEIQPTTSAPEAPAPSAPSSTPPTPGGPSITILGNNPARVSLKTVYVDLGATVADNLDHNLGYQVTVDGAPTPLDQIVIDTSVPGEHTITYTATDNDGNAASATRTVVVFDDRPAPPAEQPGEPVSSTSTEPAPSETIGSAPVDAGIPETGEPAL